ncbi:MAG: sugar transferase [Lachnospiraceae bacterium]|nr:sugar transferase [Lachnospiraceae bacterium]
MYRERGIGFWKHIDFIILSVMAQELAFFLAYFYRFRNQAVVNGDEQYLRAAVVVGLMDVAISIFRGSYSGVLHRGWLKEVRATIEHEFIVFVFLLIYLFGTKQTEDLSRLSLGYYAVFSVIIMYCFRVSWKVFIRNNVLRRKGKTNLIVIADKKNIERCINTFKDDPYSGFTVVSAVCIDEDMTGRDVSEIPVVCKKDNLFDYLREHVIDQAFLDMENIGESYEIGRKLIEIGVTCHISLLYSEELIPTRVLENFDKYSVLTGSMKIANTRQVVMKRAMDIVGSLVGLVFTFIAFLIFAPIIKIQSPGPVFYKSVRIGKNGRKFYFYKFRSMYVDADKHLKELQKNNEIKGLMFKMENDPRIIPIGHFIRKYSIDELPQFWNVLKGEMSLVGTRPPTEGEFKNYEYHHKARLAIKPGLTGLWQVSGRSNITDFEDVVKLDTEYIANWTLGLDIKILLRTVGVVFKGTGSK